MAQTRSASFTCKKFTIVSRSRSPGEVFNRRYTRRCKSRIFSSKENRTFCSGNSRKRSLSSPSFLNSPTDSAQIETATAQSRIIPPTLPLFARSPQRARDPRVIPLPTSPHSADNFIQELTQKSILLERCAPTRRAASCRSRRRMQRSRAQTITELRVAHEKRVVTLPRATFISVDGNVTPAAP